MAGAKKKRRKRPVVNEPKLPRHGEARAIGRRRARARDATAHKEEVGDVSEVDFPSDAPEKVRLNKFLADHGIASRRKCDELIAAGKVSVDGEPINELGTKIDPDNQVVEVDGVLLRGMKRRYYLLNKPSGVVCTNEPREMRPRAVDLVTDRAKGRIYTVGRLDEDSVGLILLTNDGEFANRVMHPRFGVRKTYAVRVNGRIEDEAIEKVRAGVHLAEGRTSGAVIRVNRRSRTSSTLEVTLEEGMNREIRRAFARVGYKVVHLRRTRIGMLSASGLKTGHWRKLTRVEIESLLRGGNPAAEEESKPSKGDRGRKPRHKKHRGKRTR